MYDTLLRSNIIISPLIHKSSSRKEIHVTVVCPELLSQYGFVSPLMHFYWIHAEVLGKMRAVAKYQNPLSTNRGGMAFFIVLSKT